MFLAKMTTEQAAQAFRLDPVILLPVGSCEQHGPQCALGTDFLIPEPPCPTGRGIAQPYRRSNGPLWGVSLPHELCRQHRHRL